MCGIWGYWYKDGRPAPDEPLIRQATEVMHRRGPDDFGFFRTDSGFAMGFRRLSIIDLTTGHQPMSNEDGTVQVTLNGEIYNFQHLRERLVGLGHRFSTHSDTEVIVHGYEQWGQAVLDHLCGMFAIAIWDERRHQLLLARDRLGIKPLYYIEKPEVFGYASDPRALLSMPDVSAGIDQEALALYLYYGYVPAPWTIYKGVRKLRPGQICLVTRESMRIDKYWSLVFEPTKRKAETYHNEFSELFHEVVGEHLISDVPLGSFLSGGMDSTSVVQAATEKAQRSILTFNVAFEDSDADESFYARQAADTLKSDHHEMSLANDPSESIVEALSHFPEPFGDSAAVPNYLLSGMIRKLCTVALSGDGGDEVFAGYSLRQAQAISYLHKFPHALRKTGKFLPIIGNLCRQSLYDVSTFYANCRARFTVCQVEHIVGPDCKARQAIESHIQLMRDDLRRANVKGVINPYLFVDQSFGLPDQMLTKVDVTSMAQSLEVRVPLLDHRIVEFAATLPEEMKQKGFGSRRTKRIIRKYLGRKFPKSFIHRPKRGFGMPVCGDLRTRLEKQIQLDGNRNNLDLPDLIQVERLRTLPKSQALSSGALWALLALSTWYKNVGRNYL